MTPRLLLPALFFSFAALSAQTVTQSGYVRTVGRPENRQGTPLAGVVLRVSGQHNAVQSNKEGRFQMAFNNVQIGKTTYSFSSIRLAGYDLQEKENIGRRHAVSPTVPVEIVMVPQQLKIELEQRIRQQVELQYQKKLSQLKAQKDQLGKQYAAELQKLESLYEKRDQLVEQMVERYANTDYAHLDSLHARINTFIEAGELERADSLVQTIDVAKLERDHASWAAVEQKAKEQKNIAAQQLYAYYDEKIKIFSARFENDSLAFCYKRMADIDSAYVGPNLVAGHFLSKMLQEYAEAARYYQRALRTVVSQHDGNADELAMCYCYLYENAQLFGKTSQAREWFEKARTLVEQNKVNEPIALTTFYANLGFVAYSRADYAEALNCYQKSLQTSNETFGENHAVSLSVRSKIANTLASLERYDEALEQMQEVEELYNTIYNGNYIGLINLYSNWGNLLRIKGDLQAALEYHQKAYFLAVKLLPANHTWIAQCLNDVGNDCFTLADYNNAAIFFKEALRIFQDRFGETHKDVAMAYNNLGNVVLYQRNYAEAQTYYQKAVDIRKAINGRRSNEYGIYLFNLACAYRAQSDYSNALKFFQKAGDAKATIYGKDHMEVATVAYNMADVLSSMGNFPMAVPYYKEYLRVASSSYAPTDQRVCVVLPYLYNALWQSAQKSPGEWQSALSDFRNAYQPTATVLPNGEAAKRGLQGTYILLQFADWTSADNRDLFDLNGTLLQTDKDIVLYRDGECQLHHFSGTMGIQLGFAPCTSAERIAAEKAYKSWKKKNGK